MARSSDFFVDPPKLDLADEAWDLKQEPTNLIALLPDDEAQPPSIDQILARIQRWSGKTAQVLDRPALPGPRLKWVAVLKLPNRDLPVVMWLEPMRPLPEEHLKFLNAQSIKWALGIETVLQIDDPLSDSLALLRMLGRAFDAAAVLTVNIEGWFTKDELNDVILDDQIEPTAAMLWFVHGISADSAPTPQSKMWLYTQGLARCGLPELELLDVPHAQMGAAIALLNAVAELVLESGLPPPGQAYEIGHEMEVAFQPWQRVAPHIDTKSLGSMNNRQNHTGREMTGVHAVVCAAQPSISAEGRRWVWPQQVLDKLTQGALIYKSERSTHRQAKLARQTFDDFAAAFASIAPAAMADAENRPAVFLVQAGFARPAKFAANQTADREHVWFEVKRFKAGRVEGVLLNQPVSLPHLHKGDVTWIDRNLISDWQALTAQGAFGPDKIEHLRDAIEQIKAKGAPA